MIDEKKLMEEIVNTPSECLDSYSVSSVQQGIQYGCATRQNEIIDIINRQPQADKWIPCSERLPESSVNVIVWYEGIGWDDEQIKGYAIARYRSCFGDWSGTFVCEALNVIAWQPLPAPYKKEGAK